MKKRKLLKMRNILLAVSLIFLLAVSAYAYQKKNSGLASQKQESIQLQTEDQVLGESVISPSAEKNTSLDDAKRKIQQSVEAIGGNLKPMAQSASKTASETYSNVVKSFTTDEQKIEIDKAVEDAKKKIENLPEDIFEKARYEYCQQVVHDYESSQE